MGFPPRLLQPGEDVLLDTRARVWSLAGPVLIALAVAAGCVTVIVEWASAPAWLGWLLLAALAAALAVVGGRLLAWRSETFTVTTRRVVRRAGVLRRTSREILLLNVQSVSYHQGVGQRLARCGDLLVESAGADALEAFADVPGPAAVQSLISGALAELRLRTADVGAARQEPGSGVVDQIERLAILYERGALSRAEFEEMKAELLARR